MEASLAQPVIDGIGAESQGFSSFRNPHQAVSFVLHENSLEKVLRLIYAYKLIINLRCRSLLRFHSLSRSSWNGKTNTQAVA